MVGYIRCLEGIFLEGSACFSRLVRCVCIHKYVYIYMYIYMCMIYIIW